MLALPFAPRLARFTLLYSCFLGLLLLSTALSGAGGLLTASTRGLDQHAVYQWQQLLQTTRFLPEQQKIRRINRFFNQRIAFKSDDAVWRQRDYWATPRETLIRAAGDCEDFSIAKYMSLLLSGVSAERLRLVYVKAITTDAMESRQQAHMVLAYYPEKGAVPLILDNLISEIRPASQRPDLIPLFSFNSQGLWVAGQRAADSPNNHLSRWREVLARMQKEGLYTDQLPGQ